MVVMYSRNQFFVHIHASSTMHIIFLSPSMFSHERGWSKPDPSLCFLKVLCWWQSSFGCHFSMEPLSHPPSQPGISLWCDGGKKSSGKEARNVSNSLATLIVPSKKTLKTTDQAMSSFKFPTVSHPHQPLQSWSCQLRKYHWSWRLMPSLRQIFCTQRAAVTIPVWRSGSSITKLRRCQTDTWLTRDLFSSAGNPFWKQNRPKKSQQH